MILLPLYTFCRATALVLILLIGAVTFCTGQELCCSQFGHGEEESCCQTTEEHAHEEEQAVHEEHSCCTAEPARSDSSGTNDGACDACALCSHCGASIVPGLLFLSVELLPSGVPIYYPVLFSTVSAVYDIAEPPPNAI